MSSPIRFYIWPRYVLKANGRRVRFKNSSKFAIVLALLVAAKGAVVPHEDLIGAAYFGDLDGGPLWAESCLKVAMCKMRRILNHLDLEILNDWGRGYRLVSRK